MDSSIVVHHYGEKYVTILKLVLRMSRSKDLVMLYSTQKLTLSYQPLLEFILAS